MMKIAILMAVFITGFASPALACRAPQMEQSVFFKTAPQDAEVLVKVIITKGWKARLEGEDSAYPTLARVTEVLRGHVKVGDIVELNYELSDCGPWPAVGESGLIAASHVRESDGYLLMDVETHSFGEQ